jgi:hypothetical protein
MNEGTLSGKSTIRLLGISAERPTNGLYLLLFSTKEVLLIHVSLLELRFSLSVIIALLFVHMLVLFWIEL